MYFPRLCTFSHGYTKCGKHFVYSVSFYSGKSNEVNSNPCFTDKRHWGSERLSKLPKIISGSC